MSDKEFIEDMSIELSSLLEELYYLINKLSCYNSEIDFKVTDIDIFKKKLTSDLKVYGSRESIESFVAEIDELITKYKRDFTNELKHMDSIEDTVTEAMTGLEMELEEKLNISKNKIFKNDLH